MILLSFIWSYHNLSFTFRYLVCLKVDLYYFIYFLKNYPGLTSGLRVWPFAFLKSGFFILFKLFFFSIRPSAFYLSVIELQFFYLYEIISFSFNFYFVIK